MHEAHYMFDHFILTRFNVPLPHHSYLGENDNHPGLNEEWLTNRFKLFERICLPSVNRQTRKTFFWFVFLDARTPDWFRDRMSVLSASHGCLTTVYCSDFSEEFVMQELDRRQNVGFLRITTRLDNDDAIHPRMVEKIHEQVKKRCSSFDLSKGFFISFPIGCCECEGDFYIQRFRYNPFISFVSTQMHRKSALGFDHTKIARSAPVFMTYTRPLWCQVIHGDNVSSMARGVYWPPGKFSAFSDVRDKNAKHSLGWVLLELFRSAKGYYRH